MGRRELREAVETLQNLLVAKATGAGGSDADYRQLRDQLLAEASLREILPTFLRTARDLSQFWAYIKKDYGRYDQRREHIWSSFRPVLEFLGSPEGTAPPAAQASQSLASVLEVPDAQPQTTRVFISYSTKNKTAAAAVRNLLVSYGMECFLAHDDLQISEEWKERILEELLRCNIFIPLLSKEFRESDWAPQEIGVVSGRRDIAIVPLSLDGTIPFGFISNIQGRVLPQTGVTPDLIITPLLKKFPRLIIPGMVNRVRSAGTFRDAEAAMKPLEPYFGSLTNTELIALIDASIENGQVWSATECRMKLLPKLIAINSGRIPPEKLKALSYQIENDSWYPGETVSTRNPLF